MSGTRLIPTLIGQYKVSELKDCLFREKGAFIKVVSLFQGCP